jgi:hypothetical protein
MQHRNLPKESTMTTATLTTAPAGSLRHYLQDVGVAIRAFVQALFAAQDRQFVAQEVRTSQAATAKGRRQLLSLAKQYDDLSPSLSAELRTIAGRN